MDDSVCPLCCEELDLSDREFYPCQCGYQVCMWCWHRIRETESGLCPACRTPYGQDPHQFSAVDVEKAIQKKKQEEEKEQAAKQRGEGSGDATTAARGRGSASGDNAASLLLEVPKDRSVLANMRVIRRNLVYAVGLPVSVAKEETLRQPAYFGQYGKISKIVLNRSQQQGGAPSNSGTASAYVTFVHKEDTLACILALDGFSMESGNRSCNIRASYGTSKYCSAFIKNVKCNNPECTYLHEMGSPQDTFTKQEIQAGYVTSGRDVLQRQQQIFAEEQQKRMGAGGAGRGGGGRGSGGRGATGRSRKVVGNGGPSGTGRASGHPVFPPPEFDEPVKQATAPAPAMPGHPGRTAQRSMTMGPGNANTATASAAAAKGKHARSASLGGPGGKSPARASAASVVAGVYSVSNHSQTESTTSLTPLTPLKRTSKAAKAVAATNATATGSEQNNLSNRKNGRKAKNSGGVAAVSTASTASSLSSSSSVGGMGAVSAVDEQQQSSLGGSGEIGGAVIGPPSMKSLRTTTVVSAAPPGGVESGNQELLQQQQQRSPTLSPGAMAGGTLSDLGGQPIDMNRLGGGFLTSSLGGQVYTGQLPGSSAIGGNKNADKWSSSSIGGTALSTGPMLGGNNSSGLWNSGGANDGLAPAPGVGGEVIGSHASSSVDSSSALASILGINLPTGSGSLHESTNIWPGPSSQNTQGPSTLSALNGSSIPSQGAIGLAPGKQGGSSLIGGVPIGGGGGGMGGSSALNPPGPPQGEKNDVALLQSLLPGVHVTSGSNAFGYGGGGAMSGGDWGNGSGGLPANQNFRSGGMNNNALTGSWNGGGGGPMPPTDMSSSRMGAIGQNGPQQEQRRQGPGIW